MLRVAHPLVEQLRKTFLQAAGRRSVCAEALGPLARGKGFGVLDGIKACISLCNQNWNFESVCGDLTADMHSRHATEIGAYAGGHLGKTCGMKQSLGRCATLQAERLF